MLSSNLSGIGTGKQDPNVVRELTQRFNTRRENASIAFFMVAGLRPDIYSPYLDNDRAYTAE